jgi:hypothetical protein
MKYFLTRVALRAFLHLGQAFEIEIAAGGDADHRAPADPLPEGP